MTLANQNGVIAKGQCKKSIRNNLLLFFFHKEIQRKHIIIFTKTKIFWTQIKNNKVKKTLHCRKLYFSISITLVVLSPFINKAKGNWCLSPYISTMNSKAIQTSVFRVAQNKHSLFRIKLKNDFSSSMLNRPFDHIYMCV